MGKPVHVAFDGGRMTSDAGILLLAGIEQRLGVADLAFKMAMGRLPESKVNLCSQPTISRLEEPRSR